MTLSPPNATSFVIRAHVALLLVALFAGAARAQQPPAGKEEGDAASKVEVYDFSFVGSKKRIVPSAGVFISRFHAIVTGEGSTMYDTDEWGDDSLSMDEVAYTVRAFLGGAVSEDVDERGSLAVAGPTSAHEAVRSFRDALAAFEGGTHEVCVSFLPGTRSVLEAARKVGLPGIITREKADEIIASAHNVRHAFLSVFDDSPSRFLDFDIRAAVLDSQVEIAAGDIGYCPIVRHIPLGRASGVVVARLSAARASLVEMYAQDQVSIDPWRTRVHEGQTLEFPNLLTALSGAEFVLPDGCAALFGVGSTMSDAARRSVDITPASLIIVRVPSSDVESGVKSAGEGFLFRLSPLERSRVRFVAPSLATDMSTYRYPLWERRQFGDSPWMPDHGFDPEKDVLKIPLRVYVTDPDSPLLPSYFGNRLAFAPEVDGGAVALHQWLANRERPLMRQFSVDVRLVEGPLPDRPVPFTVEHLPPLAGDALIEEVEKQANPATRTLFRGGTVALLGGTGSISLLRREAVVTGVSIVVTGDMALADPDVADTAEGCAVSFDLAAGRGHKVLVGLQAQIAAIDDTKRVDTGRGVVDHPVQRLLSVERRVEIAPGGTALIPLGAWRSGDADAPVTMIVRLTPARVE
ncbi:MAG: hypothetical protein HY719_11605 [Planctomycetes bacterium]|nr:hypothetical protein [Planctomycetota bacterium]